jgi:hypothetical protein
VRFTRRRGERATHDEVGVEALDGDAFGLDLSSEGVGEGLEEGLGAGVGGEHGGGDGAGK